ncbi:MAG: hypothetical protein JSR91_12360 [Proteobacteria bacterium]|nr:hypothetical protein [Pseudomonadota bacterium]
MAFDTCLLGPYRGPGRFYVRPGDIEATAPDAACLSGVVLNVHRTATGRRAQVSLGLGEAPIEGELDRSAEIRADTRVGLRFRCGRVFEMKAG